MSICSAGKTWYFKKVMDNTVVLNYITFHKVEKVYITYIPYTKSFISSGINMPAYLFVASESSALKQEKGIHNLKV